MRLPLIAITLASSDLWRDRQRNSERTRWNDRHLTEKGPIGTVLTPGISLLFDFYYCSLSLRGAPWPAGLASDVPQPTRSPAWSIDEEALNRSSSGNIYSPPYDR
jgi:hypothetical protein